MILSKRRLANTNGFWITRFYSQWIVIGYSKQEKSVDIGYRLSTLFSSTSPLHSQWLYIWASLRPNEVNGLRENWWPPCKPLVIYVNCNFFSLYSNRNEYDFLPQKSPTRVVFMPKNSHVVTISRRYGHISQNRLNRKLICQ